jgi:hypothetical protein
MARTAPSPAGVILFDDLGVLLPDHPAATRQ